MATNPSQKPIEIKISTVVAVSAILRATDIATLDSALQQMTGGSPDFFDDEFAVLDLAGVDPAAAIDWPALLALFKRYRLNPVAVRSAPATMTDAIRAHGLSLDDGGGAVKPREESEAPPAVLAEPAPIPAPRPTPEPVPVPVPAPAAATAVVSPGAMIIDTPVRAGQRIYARGCDLIITAVVNNGAEIIADGSIHVYAALNGRALAGASGNAEARIFALVMAPELVSIAGVYRTFEEGFPPELARQPAQIRLVGDRIDILSVSSAAGSAARH